MGFGSYDESEQKDFDSDLDEDDEAESINRTNEENEVTFNFEGKDTEELLEQIDTD